MEEDFGNFTIDRRVNTDLSVVIAVRHAESVANTQGLFQGQTYDTDLSELGKKQAIALAKRLTGRGVSKIYASPLRRTYQTAFAISTLADKSIEVDNRLIETNHGLWEGKSKDWIKDNYPDLYKSWMSNPSQVQFPQGEHFMDTVRRVDDFLRTTRLDPGTVIVTHDNIVRIILALAYGHPIDEMWKHELEPAAVNIFESNVVDGKNVLKPMKVNDYTHLGGIRANVFMHAL